MGIRSDFRNIIFVAQPDIESGPVHRLHHHRFFFFNRIRFIIGKGFGSIRYGRYQHDLFIIIGIMAIGPDG